MRSLFANRTYARLFAAQCLSLIGTGLTTVALGLLAHELAGAEAGLVLGTALTLKMVAYVGLARVAGAMAQALPRRGFLVGLDLARAGFVLLLPFVDATWQVYLLVFLFQGCSAAFTPTFQATIPDVLTDEREYTRALSLSRLAYDLESLLSPALVAVLLLAMPFDGLFAGTALGFLASAGLVLSARLPGRQDGGEAPLRRRVWRGAWIYLATLRLSALLALMIPVSAAGAMVIVNTVVLVKTGLGGDDRAVAVFLAAAGFGSMAVALALPRLLARVPESPVMLAGGGLLAGGLALGALGPGHAGGLVLRCLLGIGGVRLQTPAGLLLRRSCHAGDRPALFAAQFALSHSCWLAAYPAAGWMGAELGLGTAFAVLAAVAAAGTLLALGLWPARDPVERLHTHRPMAHAHRHPHDGTTRTAMPGPRVRPPTATGTGIPRSPTAIPS